jgi:putative transcriptional regulator
MPAIGRKRWGMVASLIGAVLVGALAAPRAAAFLASAASGPATSATTPEPHPGDLLVAAATIQDPRFYHAVILVVRDDSTGAFGIVINRPLGKRPIAALLAAIGDTNATGITGTIAILAGGPVEPQDGFIVHSAEYRRATTLAVDGRVALTSSPQALRDIGRGKGPKQSFFALGYAGWGPGQLAGEIARRDWFTAADDPALVFATDRTGMWRQALARRLQEL